MICNTQYRQSILNTECLPASKNEKIRVTKITFISVMAAFFLLRSFLACGAFGRGEYESNEIHEGLHLAESIRNQKLKSIFWKDRSGQTLTYHYQVATVSYVCGLLLFSKQHSNIQN